MNFLLAQSNAANTLMSSPAFWATFAGFLFLFLAGFELAKKYGLIPSKTDKRIESLEKRMNKIMPESLEVEQTPVGHMMAQVERNHRMLKHIHELLETPRQVTPKFYCALREKEMEDLIRKLENSDAITATQLIKITKLLTLQNRRIRMLVQLIGEKGDLRHIFTEEEDDLDVGK